MNGVTQVSEHVFEIGGMGASVAQEPPAAPEATPVLPTSKPAPTRFISAPEAPLNTRAILAQLKTRLRDVKREIARLRNLERERDQLQRLIKAANTELDNVRRLRAAG